jgi:hypothetical protein
MLPIVQLNSPDISLFGTSFQRQTGANIIPGEKITIAGIRTWLIGTTIGTKLERPNNLIKIEISDSWAGNRWKISREGVQLFLTSFKPTRTGSPQTDRCPGAQQLLTH